MKSLKALIIGGGLAILLPVSAQTIYLTTIGSFDGTNGAQTRAGLVEGTNGNFYGVGYTGGANGLGTVFELAPGGPVTNLYNFTGGAYLLRRSAFAAAAGPGRLFLWRNGGRRGRLRLCFSHEPWWTVDQFRLL